MKEINKLKGEIEKMEAAIPKLYINSTFAEILQLNNASSVIVNVPAHGINNHPAELSKNDDKGFTLIINNTVSYINTSYDIELINGNQKFRIDDLYIGMKSTKLTRNVGDKYFTGIMSSQASLRQFSTEDFSTSPSFYRFVIPFGSGDLRSYIYSSPYKNESTIFAKGMVKVSIEGLDFSIYETKYDKLNYLIIDADDKIDFEKFADICFSVMVGYGFLSGDFIQNEAYYVRSEDNQFKTIDGISYSQLRESIITHGTTNPIHVSPYSYTQDPAVTEKFDLFLKIFDCELFGKLCAKINSESEYATLILLILESNKSSLILRPAGYSVALEKITNIIVEENAGLKPIPDKKISRELIKKMHLLLNEYEEQIKEVGNEDSMIILTKNIDRLNSPTNQDKLSKPFKIYDIILTPKDIEAIGKRNSFLHARALQIEEGSSEFLEIFMTALRLNKLVNKLILKHLGFSGHIINHLKHNEKLFATPIDEELFELI
ncbi:hypothetical protein [Flavobacterium sedimenticola]|uniref:ApeA N-terminal domain-containing protein n=1 Tax=Flavobacterium sedimenticola TaxID=3043286 RepID=A0ABT6XS91_9FLAO|nr:hypothetical protein [Flavobacterium sedimenticola]MDI9257945.1 hypothetical protein [Flavobacterium sedimenticola]